MCWAPGCTIMIQLTYLIHCIHYLHNMHAFQIHWDIFLKKLIKYAGPRGSSDAWNLGHNWARAEIKASLVLGLQWWQHQQYWGILMQEVKERVGQRRSNRLYQWTLLGKLPSPKWQKWGSGGSAKKTERKETHPGGERGWPYDHRHLCSPLLVRNLN